MRSTLAQIAYEPVFPPEAMAGELVADEVIEQAKALALAVRRSIITSLDELLSGTPLVAKHSGTFVEVVTGKKAADGTEIKALMPRLDGNTISFADLVLGMARALGAPPDYWAIITLSLGAANALAADCTVIHAHANPYTVFSTLWHTPHLTRLSNADIVSAFKACDYLLLPPEYVKLLEDVAVQRQMRSNTRNHLLGDKVGAKVEPRVSSINHRLLRYLENDTFGDGQQCIIAARGLCIPKGCGTRPYEAAAQWGHTNMLWEAGVLVPSRSLRTDWRMTGAAAAGGHLMLLATMRKRGIDWDHRALEHAAARRDESLVIWMLAHQFDLGSQFLFKRVVGFFIHQGCYKVLSWLSQHNGLPQSSSVLRTLRGFTGRCRHAAPREAMEALLDKAIAVAESNGL